MDPEKYPLLLVITVLAGGPTSASVLSPAQVGNFGTGLCQPNSFAYSRSYTPRNVPGAQFQATIMSRCFGIPS